MKQRDNGSCSTSASCVCSAANCSRSCALNYEERRQLPQELRSVRSLYDAELQHYDFYQLQLKQKAG